MNPAEEGISRTAIVTQKELASGGMRYSDGVLRGSRVGDMVPAGDRSSNYTRCAVIECHRERGHGLFGTMCPNCAERFARIREKFGRSPEYQRTTERGHEDPRCCAPSCDAPRKRGETFCGDCNATYGNAAREAA